MQKISPIRSFIGTRDEDWADEGFHRNSTLEISIVLEGRGVFEWTEQRHLLEAGHVVIVPPEMPHRFEGYGKNRFGLIHLETVPDRIRQPLQRLLGGPSPKPKLLTLSRLDKERFERLFREWLRIKSSEQREQEATFSAWVEVMILFLLEHSQSDKQALTITNAADYIRENLQQGVHISDLAGLAGLTEAGFRRLFQQVYHMSPKQYQNQCRMAEAKWLMNSSDKEIQQIARQIGFNRLHSFSQWFKKNEGVSPSEWRKSQQLFFGR